MHIGLVGGLDRGERRYEELAASEGHSLECHTGDVAGRGASALESLVERSDLVIVVTDINSHGGVLNARRVARTQKRRCVLVRRLGTARFRALLDELRAEDRRSAWPESSRRVPLEESLAELMGGLGRVAAR